jgi:hypothetical protein
MAFLAYQTGVSVSFINALIGRARVSLVIARLHLENAL